MRILHVTPTVRPAIGGIEAVVEGLCLKLAERGHVADIAHVAPQIARNDERFGHSLIHRVPLIGHPFAGLAPALGPIACSYDLLHVHDPQLLAITASVILFCRGMPAVLSTHGGYFHSGDRALAKALHQRLLARTLLKRYALVLASSKSDLERFGKFSPRCVLAENGVDVRRFSAIEPALDRSPYSWLYWGRLSRNKRVDLVVDLAVQARAFGYPVTLTICGNDFDGSGVALAARISRGGLDFVRMLPGGSDDKIANLVRSAGIYVIGSEHEGFGLTVIEAMASGLAVIARDVAPLNGFVDNDNGLILRFDGGATDAGRLQNFLSALPSCYEALSRAARSRAQFFAWDTRIDDFLHYYATALKRGPEAGAALQSRQL